jgi:hypothetical protein
VNSGAWPEALAARFVCPLSEPGVGDVRATETVRLNGHSVPINIVFAELLAKVQSY